MKKSLLFQSVVFLVLMFGLTSCYTQLGYVSQEQAYEDYRNNPEAYEDEIDDYETSHVLVRQHVYIPAVYHPTYVYFDPYDEWYYEPGLHFRFGYYTGPAYIYTGGYFCYPPVHYPHYYPPHHYPYPVYGHPVWVHGGHHGPRYTYNPPVMKRRGFTRRGERVIASRSPSLKRRSSGQLTRRTTTNAPSNGSTTDGRRRIDKRRTKYNDPVNPYYGRNTDRKRTNSTYTKKSTNEERRNSGSRNRKTYTTKKSENSDSGYKRPASKRSSGSSKKRVSGSSTKRSTPAVSPRSSSGSSRSGSSRSSGSSVRSGSSSRSSSSSSGGSRSSSGSSRSSSNSSGKSRRR